MCDKDEEINFVAQAQNWEQRVSVEMEAARMWEEQWGSLYNDANDDGDGTSASSYSQKLELLERERKKCNSRMCSLSRTSYKAVKGYPEWHDFRRRSIERRNAQQRQEEEAHAAEDGQSDMLVHAPIGERS